MDDTHQLAILGWTGSLLFSTLISFLIVQSGFWTIMLRYHVTANAENPIISQ
jgi:hypothetical protein